MGRLRSMFAPKAANAWSDPRAWSPLGGGISFDTYRRTQSGENVSPERALTLPAYLACIKNKSEDIASLPWKVYRPGDRPGSRVAATESPAWRLLHDSPNPEMSSFTFRELLLSWASGWGLGIAEIERTGGDGEPVALWPIHPSRVWIRRVNGEPIYYVRNDDDPSRPIPLRQRDVFAVHGLGSDGVCGYSTAQMMAETIGVGLAAQRYGAAVFGNDTAIGVVFTTPVDMSEQQINTLNRSLKAHLAGASNSFNPFVASGGMKVERLGIPPKDAQMIEAQKFTIEQMARAERMPVSMIGVSEPFANVEQLGIRYVTFTLRPWCVRLEQEAQRKLFDGRPGWSSEIHLQGLMRGDYAARTSGYRTMISTGAMTPNEARSLENLEPSDEDGADRLWMQGAMATLDNLAREPEPVPPQLQPGKSVDNGEDEDDDPPAENMNDKAETPENDEDMEARLAAARLDALRPVFLDVSARAVHRHTKAADSAIKKNAGDVSAFERWARSFHEKERSVLVEAFAPVCESVGCRPETWLMEAAHDEAMDAGRVVVHAFGSGEPMPDEAQRIEALAGRMMDRARKALGGGA